MTKWALPHLRPQLRLMRHITKRQHVDQEWAKLSGEEQERDYNGPVREALRAERDCKQLQLLMAGDAEEAGEYASRARPVES